ncbi:synaptobrevin homolog YKT6-like [Symsagittifera roscoffensis]|uniref:synaptobrevin homolog YKT6-like n=1 Tax=Symsagittifera roscoffensis TaxID=84072 RepID=UPI00307B1FCF
MKIYYVGVLEKSGSTGKTVISAEDVSNFSYFYRKNVQQFLKFTSEVVVGRTNVEQRVRVQEKEYFCYCFVRTDGLSSVLISDNDYPQRVAFTLLMKILEEYKMSASMSSDWLQKLLMKYQDPHEADSLLKVQKELDETKVVLHSTIESVLNRGEKLDDLVAQSDALSATSKTFYTTAKKNNSCCGYF